MPLGVEEGRGDIEDDRLHGAEAIAQPELVQSGRRCFVETGAVLQGWCEGETNVAAGRTDRHVGVCWPGQRDDGLLCSVIPLLGSSQQHFSYQSEYRDGDFQVSVRLGRNTSNNSAAGAIH